MPVLVEYNKLLSINTFLNKIITNDTYDKKTQFVNLIYASYRFSLQTTPKLVTH